MPWINGRKVACEACIRGHRSSSCNHDDRELLFVKRPGRPLTSCPHPASSKTCECRVPKSQTIGIPKTRGCGGCSSKGSGRPLAPAVNLRGQNAANTSPKGHKSRVSVAARFNDEDGGSKVLTLIAAGGVEHPEAIQSLYPTPVRSESQDSQNTSNEGVKSCCSPRRDSKVGELPPHTPFGFPPTPPNVSYFKAPNGKTFQMIPVDDHDVPPMNEQGFRTPYPPMTPNSYYQSSQTYIQSQQVWGNPMQNNGVPMTPSISHNSSNVSLEGMTQKFPQMNNSTVFQEPFNIAPQYQNQISIHPPGFTQFNSNVPQFVNFMDFNMPAGNQGLNHSEMDLTYDGLEHRGYSLPGSQYALPPDLGSLDHPLRFDEWQRSNLSNPLSQDRSRGNPDRSQHSTNGSQVLGSGTDGPEHLQHGRADGVAKEQSIDSCDDLTLVHSCTCGDSCECLGCIAHPFNATTQQYAKTTFLEAIDNGSNHGSTPATPTHSRGPSRSQSLRSPTETTPTATGAEQDFRPENYLWVEYNVGNGCGGDADSCPCGDDCACIACSIHKPWTVPGYMGERSDEDGSDLPSRFSNSNIPVPASDNVSNAVSSCCSGKGGSSAPAEEAIEEDGGFMDDFVHVDSADAIDSSIRNADEPRPNQRESLTPKAEKGSCCSR